LALKRDFLRLEGRSDMNCEVAHERIVTAAYGELADEQTHELERHMAGCPECRTEREQLLALKVLADAHPVLEPPANLVARSRLRLEEALDALPPMRWYERLGQRMMNNFASLQAAPVAACLLLVVGGSGQPGRLRVLQNRGAAAAAAAAAQRNAAPTPALGGRRWPRRRRLPTSPALCGSPTARWWRCATTRWCRSG
jgi:anti-sigma factor RsiW